MRFSAVIIAAGLSSRMKDFKPLLPLMGRPALYHCLDLFDHPQIDQIIVVTGHRQGDVAKSLQGHDAHIVHNPHYKEGMFSSICCGLENLAPCDGVFLLPVDIPLVRPRTLHSLMDNFTGEYTLFPQFKNTAGHPPLIPGKLISEILSYNGDGGLQKFLLNKPHKNIEVWDEASLLDMDSPEDYSHLQTLATIQEKGTRAEVDAIAQAFMPAKGVRHGATTAQVALRLAKALPQDYDLELIYNSALLHDIAKGEKHHEEAGGNFVQSLGLSQLAPIIAAHQSLPCPADDIFTEKDIVCLADKIVRGSKRVSIEERFKEKLRLYENDQEAINAINRRYHDALATTEAFERVSGRDIYHVSEGR